MITQKMINAMVFPIIAIGLFFLFGIDFLYNIYLTGHANVEQEKEIGELIIAAVTHWISKGSVDK